VTLIVGVRYSRRPVVNIFIEGSVLVNDHNAAREFADHVGERRVNGIDVGIINAACLVVIVRLAGGIQDKVGVGTVASI